MDKIKRVYIFSFVMVFILSKIFLSVLDKKAMPVLTNYASVQTKRIAMEVLRESGTEKVNQLIKNENLFKITKNKEDEIESIDFDIVLVNEVLSLVSQSVQERLKEIEKGKNMPDEVYADLSNKKLKDGILYEVPLGVASGNSFFSNIGPKIPVKIKHSGNVGLDVKSRVKEYGINSALVEIYIRIEVTQKMILPFQSKDVVLTSELPIVMKVIKGNVPNYLLGEKSASYLRSN